VDYAPRAIGWRGVDFSGDTGQRRNVQSGRRGNKMTIAKASRMPSLHALARGRVGRRHAGSVLAAWAQVGLALVIALGSIGLASVAALIAPDPGVQEQVAVRAAVRAERTGDASPPAIRHR
jgi:hypothetical protein